MKDKFAEFLTYCIILAAISPILAIGFGTATKLFIWTAGL